MLNEEKAGALALNTIFGYTPKISKSIIDALGSASAVFKLSREELDELFGPYSKYREHITQDALLQAERELQRLDSEGIRFLSILDDDYPEALRDCEDPPCGLYVRGQGGGKLLPHGAPAISIVGTRDISPYGTQWCAKTVDAIARANAGAVIVSGLAIGVDITAHCAALDCGLPTIAVIPTGADAVYPRRHAGIAARIAAAPGCALITDYPRGTAVQPVNFLRRNRIIAGLGRATVLIESKSKGGGTMTARLAAGYGREVFALPGRIDDIRSEGCNLLIREKLAEPLTSLPAFIQSLGLGHLEERKAPDIALAVNLRFEKKVPQGTLTSLRTIARAVHSERGVTSEQLCRETGIPYPEVTVLLGMLETEGLVRADLLGRFSEEARF